MFEAILTFAKQDNIDSMEMFETLGMSLPKGEDSPAEAFETMRTVEESLKVRRRLDENLAQLHAILSDYLTNLGEWVNSPSYASNQTTSGEQTMKTAETHFLSEQSKDKSEIWLGEERGN
jgi:hypothetical protein